MLHSNNSYITDFTTKEGSKEVDNKSDLLSVTTVKIKHFSSGSKSFSSHNPLLNSKNITFAQIIGNEIE